jgi:hypothetical protein
MNHYLECSNPKCRFVLDLRIDGKANGHRRFILTKCPECGEKWSTKSPMSRTDLGAHWLAKLPPCSCCSRKVPAQAQARAQAQVA